MKWSVSRDLKEELPLIREMGVVRRLGPQCECAGVHGRERPGGGVRPAFVYVFAWCALLWFS